MTIELTNDDTGDFDLAQELANFRLDDSDIALERMVAKAKVASNPFFVGEDPIDSAMSSWQQPVHVEAGALPENQTFDITTHPEFADFGVEDIHVSDVDFSAFQ
jgi:hypothetical protein